MAGTLAHSPAEIVRQLLVDLELGVNPPSAGWQAYSTSEPTSPDNVITVYDTAGRSHGRDSVINDRQEHHGIQVRVRSATFRDGWLKSNIIAQALDRVIRDMVVIGSATYLVNNLVLSGESLPIGYEAGVSKRRIFVVNGLITVRQQS